MTILYRSTIAIAALSLSACVTGGATWNATAVAQAKSAIADEAKLDPRTFPVRTVAVLPLAAVEGDTIGTPLGFALAELLANDLQRSGRVQVVERARTTALLQELALAKSGRVDSATAPRTGKLLGARRITTGSIVRAGNDYSIRLRVVDVATGEIVPASAVPLQLDKTLAAEQTALLRLMDALGITLSATQRDEATRGVLPIPLLPALVSYGRGSMALAAGDISRAQRQYREATRQDPSFALAKERADEIGGTEDVAVDATAIPRAIEGVNDQIVRPAPIRTPEATDPTAVATQRLVTLIIQIGFP